MFYKPFKVKSNNQLKSSERKKLCDEIIQAYPILTEEQVQLLLPKKEAVTAIKIVTHSGQLGKLYCAARIPMFFQFEAPTLSSWLFPTIFTLWHHPDLLYSFTTHRRVVSKLTGGADLMLPGVILEGPPTIHSFGKLQKGTAVSINTDENKAPIAVGITVHSSYDMYMSGGHGKCVEIYHVIGDTLCQLGKPLTIPDLGPATSNANNIERSNVELHTEIDNLEISSDVAKFEVVENKLNIKENSEEAPMKEEQSLQSDKVQQVPTLDPVVEMDELLEYCFLKACKTSITKADLPMLSSTFSKNHLMAVCPPGQNIDIKKSSYKKLSVFLASMKHKGVIETSTVKGVEKLLSVQFNHPLLKALVVTEESSPSETTSQKVPTVVPCYKVTADVLPILSKFGYERGDILSRAEARNCFIEYIKKENLLTEKTLQLNPQLFAILIGNSHTKQHLQTLAIEDAINKFIGRISHMHQVTFGETKLLHTGKLEPIDITVASRACNKKVTLVNNLEVFGINLQEFSKECQGIGASATVTDVPGKKTPSVLVQGNQVLYVYKLLTEKYLIKKTYIKGLEFAPKQKKKDANNQR